jgi:hypothetical protein
MRLRPIAAILVALLLLVGCTGKAQMTQEEAVRARAAEVLSALEQADQEALADLVHPTKGVRFSPYSHVETGEGGDLVFTADEIRNLDPDEVRTWGSYDGSGMPIELSFREYLNKFAYRPQYKETDQISFNEPIGKGNTINNITEAYPDGVFVEYHHPGTEEYEGMDWSSLRLVFEESGGKWYLVGVVNDQWTI